MKTTVAGDDKSLDSGTSPLDPFGMGTAALDVWKAMLADPQSLAQAQKALANAWFQVAMRAGRPEDSGKHIIEPQPGDTRWKHEAWTQNPVLDAVKEAYLLTSKAVMDAIDQAEIGSEEKQRVTFFAKQFCDAMSPTNLAFLNPAVIEETVRSGGENLKRGYENIIEDLRTNEGRPALVDKSAFKVGENVATTPGMVVFRNELMELIQYDPATPTVHQRPLVITPPWINKYYILDLQPKNSFIKYAVDNGFTTFVISWRNPDPSMAEITMEDYLELGPLTAARVVCAITGVPDVNLIGYCIGGTLVSMLLAYLAKIKQKQVNAVTFLAALTDFENAGDLSAFLSPQSVAYIEDMMQGQGVLQGNQMADTFNLLRANDLIWNVVVNRYLLGKAAPAFDLLYWNSDTTRIPRATHSYYLRNMYLENNLVKPDVLQVKGVPIDLRRVRNDVYSVGTMEDHITPWRAVYRMTRIFSGNVRFALGHSGHIAGIINPPAAEKGNWWVNAENPPLPDEWLASAQKHPGSWWVDWAAWLAQRSGERIDAPKAPGSQQYPPLVPAPGTYVLVGG
jgi:polyhydroxyalkanoate synthase subunit PhaC